MQASIGDGTSDQWVKANVVSEEDAQPGDLVFQRGPEAGSDNHVGIICGKTDAGDWIAVHCSSSKNGVTVGEAYGASFRYIRQPSFYPTAEELAQLETDYAVTDASDVTDLLTGDTTVSDTLQDAMDQDVVVFEEEPTLPALPKILTDDSDRFGDNEEVVVFKED